MNQRIYERLIQVARDETTIPYRDVAPLADLDMSRADHRNQMAAILDEISRAEHEAGRPLLSAVVVHAEGDETAGIPGQGFFTMARSLGLYDGRDRVTFFARELTRVHDEWRA